MAKKKKHTQKHKKCKPGLCTPFAPVYPRVQISKTSPGPNQYSGQFGGAGHGGAIGGGAPTPAAGGGVAGENKLPPSKSRVLHEIRMVLETANPVWVGYSAPSPAIVTKQNSPQPSGSGFEFQPAHGNFNYKNSPGLGFRSEKAWKVWIAALDILSKNPSLPIYAVMQAANSRAGVRYGDIDAAETRLLEMGLQWYLSDPSKFTGNIASDGGGQSGFGATQLNAPANG